jgi:hypothetical protein
MRDTPAGCRARIDSQTASKRAAQCTRFWAFLMREAISAAANELLDLLDSAVESVICACFHRGNAFKLRPRKTKKSFGELKLFHHKLTPAAATELCLKKLIYVLRENT